jgi:hypothetical protein
MMNLESNDQTQTKDKSKIHQTAPVKSSKASRKQIFKAAIKPNTQRSTNAKNLEYSITPKKQ